MDGQFVSWTPKSAYAPRKQPEEWERHKDELQRMQNEGKKMVEMLAILKEKYGFSANLGQLQRQLKSWSSLAAATNASSGTVQQFTREPGARSTSRKRGPPSTNASGRRQRGPSAARLADLPHQILDPCNIASPKNVAKSHGVQLQGLASLASSSAVPSTAQHRPFNEIGPLSQADLTGPMEVCQITASIESDPSGKSDSNGQVHESQYSMERQYLKDFLQYIRELMRDLLEVIRDLESRPTMTTNDDNNDDPGRESAESNSGMSSPLDFQPDESILQQDQRSGFAGAAENFKPGAVAAHQTISTKQPFDSSWPPATILAHPTSPHERVSQQHWRCASPILFSIAPSSISGMSSVMSTARRARRCHSFQTCRDQENEVATSLPSAFMKRHHSMSLSKFEDVTGMSSCPSDDNCNVDDVTLCGDDAMVEGCLALDCPDA